MQESYVLCTILFNMLLRDDTFNRYGIMNDMTQEINITRILHRIIHLLRRGDPLTIDV